MSRPGQQLASASAPYPAASSQQMRDKVALQREYREKEGECFNILRDVIKGITGKEPRTRQEVLRQAIDLLSAVYTQNKSGAHISGNQMHGTYSMTGHEFENVGPVHEGYSAHSVHWPGETWQPEDAAIAQPYYDVSQLYDQQYSASHFTHSTGSASDHTGASRDKRWG